MSPDPVMSRELKSLQEELATAQRQRPIQSQDRPAESTLRTGAGVGTGVIDAATTSRTEDSPSEQELRGQIHDLVEEINGFLEEAEKNISAHPAISIVAAMLLGIVIGSLLARR